MVRGGASLRSAARRFGVSHKTVKFWVERAGQQRLGRVDWSERRRGPRRPNNKTRPEVEELVLEIRRELREHSDLGEFGALAIRAELLRRMDNRPPSPRTIGRILERRGAVDRRYRVRRPPPPPGWYLPEVAAGRAELDSFDIVEGLVIKGGQDVEVLNGKSLHGGLAASWPREKVVAKTVMNCLLQHWRQFGVPGYVQFDNDTRFQGPHNYPDAVGRVIRVCLSLGVTPVFAPPREPGFQAAIENFNGQWQQKVWRRFRHASLTDLIQRSDKYIAAYRRRATARTPEASLRGSFPEGWRFRLTQSPRGKIIFLRRTSETGTVRLLGRDFVVSASWLHRLVRAEVDLNAETIRFYALRRRDPSQHPLLKEVHYALPKPISKKWSAIADSLT
jgi:transposase